MNTRSLLAGLARGVAGAATNYNSMQDEERKRQRNEALRAAEVAVQMGDIDGASKSLQAAGINVDLTQARQQQAQKKYGGLRDLARERFAAGNHQGAAAMVPQLAETGNAAFGENRVGPGLIQRPKVTDGPDGQMSPLNPDMSPVMETPWAGKDGEANQRALRGFLDIAPAKPEAYNLAPGHSRYVGDQRVTTAPVPERAADPLLAERQALLRAQAAAASRSNRGGGREARRPTTTATILQDGKPVTVLVDTQSGDVIRVIGEKPTSPRPPKPFDEVEADRIARNRLGIRQGRPIMESKKAAYEAELQKLRREHQLQQSGKTEADAFFDFLEQEVGQ